MLWVVPAGDAVVFVGVVEALLLPVEDVAAVVLVVLVGDVVPAVSAAIEVVVPGVLALGED